MYKDVCMYVCVEHRTDSFFLPQNLLASFVSLRSSVGGVWAICTALHCTPCQLYCCVLHVLSTACEGWPKHEKNNVNVGTIQ